MHMAEGVTGDGLKDGRYDRLLSLTVLITGAVGVIGIVFACLDWSHSSLTLLRSPSFNLLLFVLSLASFFATYLTGLWLLTHDRRRIRNTVAHAAFWLALSAIATFVARYMAMM